MLTKSEEMLSALIIFASSTLVSFIGSLQLGPVNLYVINSVLFNNKKTAFWIAVGGAIPEFIYCGLAVYANHFFIESILFQLIFKIIFIIVLIIIGFVFLLKKITPINVNSTSIVLKSPIQSIAKGFSLAALNPQLFPFWMLIQVYFNSITFLQMKSNIDNYSFILGAGVGAFMLLTTLLIIVDKYKDRILKYINNKYYYKSLALLFFMIAIQQLLSLL